MHNGCLAIFSRSLSMPSIRAAGRGGQPGTETSTSTTVSAGGTIVERAAWNWPQTDHPRCVRQLLPQATRAPCCWSTYPPQSSDRLNGDMRARPLSQITLRRRGCSDHLPPTAGHGRQDICNAGEHDRGQWPGPSADRGDQAAYHLLLSCLFLSCTHMSSSHIPDHTIIRHTTPCQAGI